MARHRPSLARPSGSVLALVLLVALVACGAFAAVVLAAAATHGERDRASDRALAVAREALIAYAADRPIDTVVGPGYLPCPDLDGDGWAESTCGSLSGDSGQSQRLGLLPWKTLGIPELRDGTGERLWYAVSAKYKGLLNCAASHGCVDMSPPAAIGTITLRDASGALLHDGAAPDPRVPRSGAAALVIAPGAPLARWAGFDQSRACASLPCLAAQYLDSAPSGEDNADFIDRNDAQRALNRNGFIAGPVVDAGGQVRVNDRIAAIAYGDLMPRVMARVALEAAYCLRLARDRDGSLPVPAAACGSASWGRVPAIGALDGCSLEADGPSGWWAAWRPYVAYAVAPSCASGGDCIETLDRDGNVIAGGHAFALEVGPQPDACEPPLLRCTAAACTQVLVGAGLDVSLALH